MKHISPLSRTPIVGQTTLAIKLTATLQIIDRLLLAQRQAAWKVAPSGEGEGEGEGQTTITEGQ
jgi:hypothetical protein